MRARLQRPEPQFCLGPPLPYLPRLTFGLGGLSRGTLSPPAKGLGNWEMSPPFFFEEFRNKHTSNQMHPLSNDACRDNRITISQHLTSPKENSRLSGVAGVFPLRSTTLPPAPAKRNPPCARRRPPPTGESGAGFRARVPTPDPHPRRVTPRSRGTKARGGLTHPRGEGSRVAKAPRSAGAPLPQARSAGPELAQPRAADPAARGAGEERPGGPDGTGVSGRRES